MATIGGINYQIGMDTSGFQAGTVLTRQEMGLVRKELKASRDPFAALGESVDAVKQAFVNGAISSEEYHQVMAKLNAQTPQAKAAAAEQAEAQRQLNADMQRGEQITRANETETEQYAREMAELSRLLNAGAINERDMARETQRLNVQLRGAEDTTEKMSDAMREGRALTQSLMTAEERRNAELARSKQLLASGAITQDTHNRNLAKHRKETLANVPVVGQLSSKVMGIHPAAIAAGVGLAAIAVQMRLAMAAARWLTDAVKEQFGVLDELAKKSRNLGVDAGSLESIRLAGAQMAGMEAPEMDAVLTALQKKLGETAAGTGEAQVAFQRMNLDVKALIDLPVDQAFSRIADGFARIESPAERAFVASKLFEERGLAMLEMLGKGSGGLDGYRERLDSLRDPLTGADLAGIEAMNDTFGETTLVIDGIVQNLAADLAPTLKAVAETVIEALKPGAELGDTMRFALETIPPVIAWAADETNRWVGVFQLLQAAAVQAEATVVGTLAAIDRAEAAINPFRGVNEDLQVMAASLTQSATKATAEATQRIADGTRGAIQARAREIREEIAAASRDAASGTGVSIGVDGQAEAAQAAASLSADIQKQSDTLREQIATAGMSAEAIAVWRLEQRAAAAGAEDYAQSIAKIREQQEQLKQAQAGAAVDALAASLNEQLDTVGMTADEIARYKLQQQGAAAEDVAAIAATQALLAIRREQADDEKKLADSIAQTTAALQFQIATTGMTADQIEDYKLAQAGATVEQSAAVAALRAEAKARTDQQKMIDEGKQLAESLLTDEEKKAAAIARATELRDAGAISEEQYQRALAKTNDETKRSIDLSEGIAGAAKGSLEAQLKLDAHARFLAGDGRGEEIPRPFAGDGRGEEIPRPFAGGFDPGGSEAKPPATDVDAIRERLNQNLERPEVGRTTPSVPPAVSATDTIVRPTPSPAIAEFESTMAGIAERLREIAGTQPKAAPQATAPPPPVIDLATFKLTEASAIDRLVEMMSRTNALLTAIDEKTVAPTDDREPNEDELTIRVVN